MDGKSTRWIESEAKQASYSHEFLLRACLKTFMVLGDGPVGTIDVPVYKERICWLKKRVLSEDNLIEEIVYADKYTPEIAPNGVRLWCNPGNETKDMLHEISIRSGNGANVLVVVLDPAGRALCPKW